MVEHSAVNRVVVGSSPTRGACFNEVGPNWGKEQKVLIAISATKLKHSFR